MDFAREALEHLETFTMQSIADPEQRASWIARLSTIPKWKLMKLDQFTGHLADVWKFFDSLQAPMPHASDFAVKELPEPKSNIARDTFDHYKRMNEVNSGIPYTLSEHESKWTVEIEGLKSLHAKYPHAGFDKTMRSRQQDIISKRLWLKEHGR